MSPTTALAYCLESFQATVQEIGTQADANKYQEFKRKSWEPRETKASSKDTAMKGREIITQISKGYLAEYSAHV